MKRKEFIRNVGLSGLSMLNLTSIYNFISNSIPNPIGSIFEFIHKTKGKFDIDLYRKILGSANEFKEGDEFQGISAADDDEREHARQLIESTTISQFQEHPVFIDDLLHLIKKTTLDNEMVSSWTFLDLKKYLLEESEDRIKNIMPSLESDTIACVVKLMSNDELIQVSQKIFNPLPGSNIGSKGYLSARIQPNSPTDHIDDIVWQVFNGWSYAVGDLVLGTNPVSSEVQSVARIETALQDLLVTFDLEDIMPNCVLSHIDVQAEVEINQPGSTGVWFQSLAGTVKANQTFDVTIKKMMEYASQRSGKYGLYAETGQGADFTNGHGEGFDMVIHESRKYGFLRALKKHISDTYPHIDPWVHVNDVAGFIGPEVFKSKEQLVRCCLEDTVMGKLHGLTIGLDICSTLHMEVSLEDLEWCIDQVMPANPAYLMALPTKNDPMLSYLTTAFNDHVRIREKFGYKVNDAMWDFFKRIEIIGEDNQPTKHFGDPIWVYYQYRLAKGDTRLKEEIIDEGKGIISEINERGVPIAQGHGNNIWDLNEDLDRKVHYLYNDAKVSIWAEVKNSFLASIPAVIALESESKDRKDYIYHPSSGEKLSSNSILKIKNLKDTWANEFPDVQIVISDGLNARALMDDEHLLPFLNQLKSQLMAKGILVSSNSLFIKNGRVRAGYQIGELLFGDASKPDVNKGILHIIGERPGSGHHNFSVYMTAASQDLWNEKGKVDHDITKVVSGISDTALDPLKAADEAINIFSRIYSDPI